MASALDSIQLWIIYRIWKADFIESEGGFAACKISFPVRFVLFVVVVVVVVVVVNIYDDGCMW